MSTFTYTPFGALASAADALGLVSTMAYTAQGWPAGLILPSGRATVTTYNGEGQPLSETDPRGARTTFSYDSAGRLHTMTTGASAVGPAPALNQTITYDYDANSRVVKITDPRGQLFTRTYDPFDRLVSESDPLGNTNTFGYDRLDRLILLVEGANVPAQALTTAYTYDGSDRLLSKVVDPAGLQLTSSFHYSRPGSSDTWNLQQVTDPRGNNTLYRYNSQGLLDQTTDALNQTWSYAYDNLGRMTSTQDPLGRALTRTFDALGRVTALAEAGRIENWSYNADGTLGSYTDLGGRTTTRAYDVDARLTGITYPAGTAPVSFTYDAADHVVSMTDGLGTTTYAYDAANRLTHRTRGGRTIQYSYNADDQVTQIDYGGSGAVQYGYDDAGRPISVSAWGRAPTTYTYRSTQLLASATRPNQVSTTASYDSASRLTGLAHQLGGPTPQPVQSIQCALDANGNRTQVTDGDGTSSFTYDPLNRLLQASYPALPGGPGATVASYTYDAVGNRLSDGFNLYSYDGANRLTSAGFLYDPSGNLLTDGATTYSYDGANRLVSSVEAGVTTSYGYDGWGHVVRESIGGVTTDLVLAEGGPLPNVLAEVRSDQTELTYAYGPDGLSVQQRLANGVAQGPVFPLLDGSGSIRLLTNGAGAAVRNTRYDAFGVVRLTTGNESTGQGYDGERTGAADGTIDLRARRYDPGLGRFLERDAAAGTAARPQSLNRYAYSSNNPLNRRDPAGLDDGTSGEGWGVRLADYLERRNVLSAWPPRPRLKAPP